MSTGDINLDSNYSQSDRGSSVSSFSAAPSTILDESGQSVPPSFDELDDSGERLPRISLSRIVAAPHVVRNEVDREGMSHLYGELCCFCLQGNLGILCS